MAKVWTGRKKVKEETQVNLQNLRSTGGGGGAARCDSHVLVTGSHLVSITTLKWPISFNSQQQTGFDRPHYDIWFNI